MLQKIVFESNNFNLSEDRSKSLFQPSQNILIFSKKVLYKKYSQFEYSYSLFCTNNLIFNEKCRIVARFKDYLVLDDSTEFLRRFYSKKELCARLKKIYNFYESYCKLFPNYMILPENQFLYRNIRKKQKMIDAFNEIRKEEEENRKHLKLGLSGSKRKDSNVVFTKKIQESIERCYPSLSNILSNTFISEISNNLNTDFEAHTNDQSIITISLSSQRPINKNEINGNNIKDVNAFDKYLTPITGSFAEKNFNDNVNNSQKSIFKIVQILNNDKIKDNTDISNNNNPKENINMNKKKSKELKTNHDKNGNTKNTNHNTRHNTKKSMNANKNNNSNQQPINYMNTINPINKHVRVKTNLNNSNNKKKKQEISVNTKKKFISHKQNISVPMASNMLHNNEHNINNIIGGENNTIKIINNINNIIINDDKNNTINNGMIININNNYFQLRESKQVKNNLIKRVKSKEEQMKKSSKEDIKTKNKTKEITLQKYKIFREKRTYTSYNAQINNKKNKKFLINEIQSPNSKKEKHQNSENRNKDLNSKKLILTTNEFKSTKNDNYYKSSNYANDTKFSNKMIESKTLMTNPNKENVKIKSKNNHINNNIIITEANTTISTSYNHSKITKKFISLNKNKKSKEVPKLEGVESVDKKKLTINRNIVNNYLTATQKKKTFQARFHIHENSESTNNFSSKQFVDSNNIINNVSEKIEFINICNTFENNHNPIKFKLNQNLIKKKAKTNSLQINNKNEFLSSFNLTKDKAPINRNDLEIINLDEKLVKHNKKSLKKLMNNKTQTNSEAELIKDMNKNKNVLNTIASKSMKKEKMIKKMKQSNNERNPNDKTNIENPETTKEVKKINVKEMKEKYHKLLRGNKNNHGSYDIANRLHLFKKFKGLNNIMDNMTYSINNTTTNNKRSPFVKKEVFSPSERLQTGINTFIKSPIPKRYETNKEIHTIEIKNLGSKFKLIEKRNKHMDSNNKKMKFLKK